jgi:hypothetical protein
VEGFVKCEIKFKSEISDSEVSATELSLLESIWSSIIASIIDDDRLEDD